MEFLIIPLITGGVLMTMNSVRALSSTSPSEGKTVVLAKSNQPKRAIWFTKDSKFEKEQNRKFWRTAENYTKLRETTAEHQKAVEDSRKAREEELDLFDKHLREAEEPILERKVMALCGAFDQYLDMEFPEDPKEYLAVLEAADKEYAKVRWAINDNYTGEIRKNAEIYVVDVWSNFKTKYMTASAYSKIRDLAMCRYTEVHPLWMVPQKYIGEPETFTQMSASGKVVGQYSTPSYAPSEETFMIDLQHKTAVYGINKNIIDFEWADLFIPLSKAEREKLFKPTAAEMLDLLEGYNRAMAFDSEIDAFRALDKFFGVDTTGGFSANKIIEFVEERKTLFEQDPNSVEEMRVEMEKRLAKSKDKKLLMRLWEGDVTANDFPLTGVAIGISNRLNNQSISANSITADKLYYSENDFNSGRMSSAYSSYYSRPEFI